MLMTVSLNYILSSTIEISSVFKQNVEYNIVFYHIELATNL